MILIYSKLVFNKKLWEFHSKIRNHGPSKFGIRPIKGE